MRFAPFRIENHASVANARGDASETFSINDFHRQDGVGLIMRCRARCLLILVVSVLGIGQMITACGQKGDLYLPKPEKDVPKESTAGASPAPQPGDGSESKPEKEAVSSSEGR